MSQTWKPVDRDVWEDFVSADPKAVFFQTPEWADLVKVVLPHTTSAALAATTSNGAQVLLPGVSMPRARGLIRGFESMPPGLYGGVLMKGGLDGPNERDGAIFDLLPRFPGGTVISEGPLRGLPINWTDRSERATHLLPLGEGDADQPDLERGYRKGHRAVIRRAPRDGVTVRRAQSGADFVALRNIYDQTRERWSRDPWVTFEGGFFNALEALVLRDKRVRVLLAMLDGSVVAAAVVFHQASHAAYWMGATSPEGRDSGAGTYVVHRAIQDAQEAGMRVFDFLPSGGLDTVARFKRGFGATEHRFQTYSRPQSALLRAAQRLVGGMRKAKQ